MKTLWIVLGVAVVGGGIYALTMNKKDAGTEAVKNETAETSNESATTQTGRYKSEFNEKTSMKAIAEAGGSYQCTVTSDVGLAQTKGTVFISEKKIRGEFESFVSQANMTIKTNFISDGAYGYTWTDMMPKNGVKFKITETDAKGEQSNFDQELDYSCKAWTKDASKFVVPTTITFVDVNGQ